MTYNFNFTPFFSANAKCRRLEVKEIPTSMRNRCGFHCFCGLYTNELNNAIMVNDIASRDMRAECFGFED